MTENEKMIKVSKEVYDILSTQKAKVEAIINVNRPRHKIPIAFDQIIQLAIVLKGVNEQLEDIQIEAGL